MLFYLTPVFYDRAACRTSFRWLLDLNPIGDDHRGLPRAAARHAGPGRRRGWPLLPWSRASALALAGLAAFRRCPPRFADYL